MLHNAQSAQVVESQQTLNFDAAVAQAVRILRARDSADLAVALAARKLYCDWYIPLPSEVKIAAMTRYEREEAA
jgi:hypothetical protein